MLGSRRQLCINPDVVNAPNRDHKCRSMVSRKLCEYFNRMEEAKARDQWRSTASESGVSVGEEMEPLIDIEEIIQSGHERGLCPFYLARDLQYSAELIFAPYAAPCFPSGLRSDTTLQLQLSYRSRHPTLTWC